MSASVMVITQDLDLTADLVVAELLRRGVGVARFDLAAFPESLAQTAYLARGFARWVAALRDPHREVDLSAVRAVWYRKPSPFVFHPQLTATERQWAAGEARLGFGGLLTALDARWINEPNRLAVANLKPLQLSTAAACGLTVPESLLTNDPVPGAYAVRLTVVGSRLFAARIGLPDGVRAVDWRTVHDRLSYTPIEVPGDVAVAVHALMGRLGLVYAAPDFVVDHDGGWHFVGDLNPNGQWARITPLRAAITSALADELTEDR